MATDLLPAAWKNLDAAEIRFILFEMIGRPGQYDGRVSDRNTFYLPLAGTECRLKLRFSDAKEIIAIEPGPAFDAAQWQHVVQEIESTGPIKIGRDCSFSSFRVSGCWRGKQSGVHIFPPPADAPEAPVEMAEHPCILEFPVRASTNWPITNFRRMREHRELTFLLNILLRGSMTLQPRRPRHLWAITQQEGEAKERIKWVQEYYFANVGNLLSDSPSISSAQPMEEIDAATYYSVHVGYDGSARRVPSDLDDSICRYMALSPANREKFSRAGFWLNMSTRQWADSFSASFASLAIAIEALGDRSLKPTKRFCDFIKRYAPRKSFKKQRNRMYGLRSDILHGSGLMEMDKDAHFGWSPPEEKERELMEELWGLTRVAVRNWLKNPLP